MRAGKAKSIVAGYHHTCIIRMDDSAVCWGYDQNGQATVYGNFANFDLIPVHLFATST